MQMWVSEPSRREDLCTLVLAYLQGSVPHPPIDNAVNFYQAAKSAAVSFYGHATASRSPSQPEQCLNRKRILLVWMQVRDASAYGSVLQ